MPVSEDGSSSEDASVPTDEQDSHSEEATASTDHRFSEGRGELVPHLPELPRIDQVQTEARPVSVQLCFEVGAVRIRQ